MGAIHVSRNVRPARRNHPAKDDPQDDAMASNRRTVALGGVVALLFGLVVFMTLGAPVLRYITDAGADVFVAVITAVTPP
jgi:hypothetical protein